jgi:hypothetical protein
VDSLVSESDVRPAAGNAWDILTEVLRSTFRWLVAIGLLFVVAAWAAGPGRRALAVRGTLAPLVRERTWAFAALAVIAGILLLAGPADFASLLVVLVLLALGAVWIEVTRAQTLREFPNASAPELLAGARSRAAGWWQARARSVAATRLARAPVGEADLTARLASLAELHARGELTDEEFAAAKARVLAGE